MSWKRYIELDGAKNGNRVRTACLNFTKDCFGIISQGKTMILSSVAELKKGHGHEFLDKLAVGMEELQRIIEERNRDAVAPKQKELLQYVGGSKSIPLENI